METSQKISKLKDKIKTNAEEASEDRKKARRFLDEARASFETDSERDELRNRAQSFQAVARRAGREQRESLLVYAWLRNRKYREIEGYTKADKMGPCWEARRLQEDIAGSVALRNPFETPLAPHVGLAVVLLWMTTGLPSKEVEEKRDTFFALAAAERKVAEAAKKAERMTVSVIRAEEAVVKLEKEGPFSLELAKKRRDIAVLEAAEASAALKEAEETAERAKAAVNS